MHYEQTMSIRNYCHFYVKKKGVQMGRSVLEEVDMTQLCHHRRTLEHAAKIQCPIVITRIDKESLFNSTLI